MAIYRFSMQVLGRSEGRSAVAAAAYRAGQRLRDERLGQAFDYTMKPGVVHTETLAPSDAPSWVQHREVLWNAVEAAEKRVDARVAREVQIALPVELTHEQQLALIQSFVKDEFVARGLVADLSIHREDEGNPHAHVLLTTRELSPQGFGKKLRFLDDKGLLAEWRVKWEEHANRALALAGREERIDHRSYEALGVELEPQPKLLRNPAELDTDKRELAHERMRLYQAVVRANGEKLCARPEAALELLTSKRATFSERDIQRLAHRQSADNEQYFAVLAAIKGSPELVPLTVVDGLTRYTTRTVREREAGLLRDAAAIAARAPHALAEYQIQQALAANGRLSAEQAAAVRAIAAGADLCIVEGYAGAGKSTMLRVAREAWESAGYSVVGGALAGKAAEGLTASSDIAARTLASWLWHWEQRKLELTNRHVLVIDEAGMVGTRELGAVLAHARKAGAKIVLVGDPRQLQAIEPGAPMRLLAERHGATRLSEIWRQVETWQKQASKAFGDGRTREALNAYLGMGRIHAHSTTDEARGALIEAWDARRLSHPHESSLLLAYRRKDVHALNVEARARRRAAGELGGERVFETSAGARAFAEGDRLYFLRNDRDLGVTNGTLGTVTALRGRHLEVELDGEGARRIVVDTAAYLDLDHGYAATVHKAQGVTVDRTFVLGSRYFDASASYVALSRHRLDAQLFYGREELGDDERLLRTLSRERPNAMAHEWLEAGPDEVRLHVRLEREERFLALSAELRDAELKALLAAGSEKPVSAAQVLARKPEVLAAERARQTAQSALQEALRRRDEHAARGRGLFGGHADTAQLERTVLAAQEAAQAAEARLHALREEPALRESAAREAERHNRRILEARELWRHLSELGRDEARRRAVAQFVVVANAEGMGATFRTLRDADAEQPLTVVGTRTLRGEPLALLRDDNGCLVVASADQIGPARPGEQIIVRGEHTTHRPAERSPTPGRSH